MVRRTQLIDAKALVDHMRKLVQARNEREGSQSQSKNHDANQKQSSASRNSERRNSCSIEKSKGLSQNKGPKSKPHQTKVKKSQDNCSKLDYKRETALNDSISANKSKIVDPHTEEEGRPGVQMVQSSTL